MGIAIASVECLAPVLEQNPDSGDFAIQLPLTATLTEFSRLPSLPDVPESRYSYFVMDNDNHQSVSEIELSAGIPQRVVTRTKIGDLFTATSRIGGEARQIREHIEVEPPEGVRGIMGLSSRPSPYTLFVGDVNPLVSQGTVMELIDSGLVITRGSKSLLGVAATEYETIPSEDDPFMGVAQFTVWINPTTGVRLGGRMIDISGSESELRLTAIATDTTTTIPDLVHTSVTDTISNIRIAPLDDIIQEGADSLLSEAITSTASLVSSTWSVGASIVVTGTSEIPEGAQALRSALSAGALPNLRSSWLVVNELDDGNGKVLIFQGNNTSTLPIVPIEDYWPPSWSAMWNDAPPGYLTNTRQVTLTSSITGTQYSRNFAREEALPIPLPPFINLVTWSEGDLRLVAASADAADEVVLGVVRAWRSVAVE